MAIKKGADFFVASTDPDSVAAHAKKCDLILNTVSANHNCSAYMPLLNYNGTQVLIGAALAPHPISGIQLMYGRISVSGSIVGTIEEHNEVLDFCAKHNIGSDVTVVEA